MMQFLPTEILDWFNPKDFDKDNYLNGSPLGCFLEVDQDDYPDELHDFHNDYLSLREKTEVRKEMLTDDQLQIITDNNFSLGKNNRHIPSLGNKKRYKILYQSLKLYLNLVLQLKKNYRLLEFGEQPFLKPYIKRDKDLQGEAEKEAKC